MPRTLAAMPREAFDFFIPPKVLRAGDGYNTIYAMHWDGTYRDRCDPGTYWDGEWDNDRLARAQKIAKHLEAV